MVSTPRDLDYEYDLLQKISGATVDGMPLAAYTYCGHYSLWHRVVQHVFSSDILRFAKTRSFEKYLADEGKGDARSLKGYAVGLLGVLISFLGVLSWFVRRPRVVVYGIDRISDREYASDFRMHEVYAWLRAQRFSFGEVLHTVFTRDFVARIIKRPRMPLYLEASDVLYSVWRFFFPPHTATFTIGGLKGLSDEEVRFATYTIKKYLGQKDAIEFRVKILTAILKMSRARLVVAIDDVRHYHDILLAAGNARIPSAAIQHGHLTRYHVGWLQLPGAAAYVVPTYFVAWSTYWKKELDRLGGVFSAPSIRLGAPVRIAPALPPTPTKEMVILVPYESDSPHARVGEVMQHILAIPHTRIVFKLRPDHPREMQIAGYGGVLHSPRVITVSSLAELTERPTAVIGVYSTFLYEMVSAQVPVGVLVELSPYGRGMVENGLAISVSAPSLAQDVAALVATDSAVTRERKSRLEEGALPLGETLDIIADEVGLATL